MNPSLQALCPKVCERLEVFCDTCVGSRARAIAKICPGLTNANAAVLFRTLYPSTGCEPMREMFVESYCAAIGDQFELSAPDGILAVV